MSSKIEISYVREYELCDRNHLNAVKGISVIAALIAYVAMSFFGVPNMGHIIGTATAVFAMCSGYGLSESYIKKRGLFHYWENKVIKVWLPSLVVLVLTSILDGDHVLKWVTDSPIGLSGNTLYLIVGGYVFFWLAVQMTDKRAARVSLLFVIAIVAFFLIPDSVSIRKAVLAMPVGVLFSQCGWKYKIRKFSWKGETLLFLACGVIAVGAWFLAGAVTLSHLEDAIWMLFYLSAAAALIFGTWLFRDIPIFGLFVPFGMASYGFYLTYKSVVTLLEGRLNWRTGAIVAILLCVVAAVFTIAREFLIAWNRRQRSHKKTHLKGSMR